MKKLLPLILIGGVILIFFWQFLLKGFLPIPSDTIVGLYYPFRDVYFQTNPNGLPYKNFLITDPVRQQIPWKNLVVEAEKRLTLPLWNPYNFAGTPLLANFQSAAFYPLNLLFYFLPFELSWSLLILLQPLLAGIFLYLYLRNLKLKKIASVFGAISFSLCGFFVAWLEWGTILNTALWLPLILLSIDKIFQIKNNKSPSTLSSGPKGKIKNLLWPLVFILSLVCAFFAGHLQTFFYLAVIVLAYFLARWFQHRSEIKSLLLFIVICFVLILLVLPQLIPTLQFIALSARNLDFPAWQTNPGWFIPWQNLIQFLAPDFFGNPATLNYYGIWNYGEFSGYIGILPLVMAFFALFFRKDKKTLFFGSAFFVSLLFALPTIFAKLPFQFNLPFIATAQPTRLLFITDFSLSVLAAFGLDYFLLSKNRKYILPILIIFGLGFVGLWSFVLRFDAEILSPVNLTVAKQNLILPTLIFILISILILIVVFYQRNEKLSKLLFGILVLITIGELLRFGWKFEPFTNQAYFFPSTSVMAFLQKQEQPFRIMATDSRILPPNFSSSYKLQTLDGYDPLYLQRFGELMAALKRDRPDITPPFGFNRIITPQDPSLKIIDLLGVKYVLSLDKLSSPKLKPVFTDGFVQVYENQEAFPRAFFVKHTLIADSNQQAIDKLFSSENILHDTAVVENVQNFKANWSLGQARIIKYEPNIIDIQTTNAGEGFLVLTDSFYPTWHATIDGREATIYLTDYNFRGIIIPKGKHLVEFYDTLF